MSSPTSRRPNMPPTASATNRQEKQHEIPHARGRTPGFRDRHRLHADDQGRSEEHTSELQSLMRNSYAVFCLNKKKEKRRQPKHILLKSDLTTTAIVQT